MNVTMKDAARRIREHNKIHQRAEPRNSPIITEILEVAAVLFEKIGAGEYQPVRHGRWIHDMVGYVRCSVCDNLEENGCAIVNNYCANCGAKMDGGDDNAEIH